MKNQKVLRILAVAILAIAMMLTVASCNLFGAPEETTPAPTKPTVTTPAATTPEPTTPEHVHTEEIIPAVAPTCTATGLTEGKKCSECGDILVPQETVAVVAHTEEVVTGKAPTCNATGLTDGKKCSVCGEILVAQETIATVAHTEEVIAGEAATCTKPGLTDGKKCSVCGEILVPQEPIAVVAHTEEVIPGEAATCTETGLTDGKKCSVCGEILVAQETIAVVDHDFVDGVCSVCGTPEVPQCETHSYMVDYVNNPQRKYDFSWGVCTVCGYVDDNHEHKVEAGKCVYCDYVFESAEVESLFDYDGVEGADVFNFAAALPEKFQAEDVVFVSAWENLSTTHSAYDEVASGTNSYPDPLPYKHYYITKGNNEYLLYNVEVAKAGIYEMAVHIRLKDSKDRGAKFLVNEGTENEYYFETSYGWADNDTAFETRNNDKLIGSYMYGIKIALQEGVNTIKITEASCDKTQHFRGFYFLWTEDLPVVEIPECETHSYMVDYVNNPQRKYDFTWGVCTVCGYVDDNHEHKVEAGKCVYCDYVFESAEVESLFDYDGVEGNDVFNFAAALPEEFQAEDVVFVSAWENLSTTHSAYDEVAAGTNSYPDPLPYKHYYITKGNNEYLLYNVEVEKAGVYEMAVHIRLKDSKDRGAKFLVNEGTENEYYFETSYGWADNDTAFETRNNDKLIGSYMYGIKINLQKGVNTIKITEASCEKTQHFRGFYFRLVEAEPTVVTVDEAIEIGMAGKQWTGTGNAPADYQSEDWYLVTITANSGSVNQTTGFCRTLASDGETKLAVAEIILGEGQTMPQEGDTFTVLAKIGRIATGEVRLYGCTIVG